MARRSPYAAATATEKAAQRRENRRQLQERVTAEGNLMEYPIWALSNKEARPTMPDPTGARDANGKVKKVPDPSRYKRTVDLETRTASGIVMRRVEVEAHPDHGFPNIVALEMFVYLCEVAQRTGFASPYVPFTYYQFAKATHRSTAGASIATMREQLRAMLRTTISFQNAWCRHPTPEEVHAATQARQAGTALDLPRAKFLSEQELHIITGMRIRSPAADGGTPKDVLEVTRGDEPENLPASYIRLADEILWSLRAGYRFGLDPDYLFNLRLPLSKRMYVLLTKRDDRKPRYEQDLLRFCTRLGMKRTRGLKDAMDQLRGALEELQTPMPNGKVLLSSTNYLPDSKKIEFVFARATRPRSEEVSAKMHEYLRGRVRDDPYGRWFAPVSFALDDRGGVQDVLVLQCPDEFHSNFLRDNYEPFLNEAAANILGKPTQLAFVVKPAEPAPPGEK